MLRIITIVGLVYLVNPISAAKEFGIFQEKAEAPLMPVPMPKNCILNARAPNPLNPQTYFQCSANGPTLMKCPDRMVYEAASSACIRDNIPPPGETPPNCMTLEYNEYIPSSRDCSYFWKCSNGKAYGLSCGANLNFNAKQEVCDWPHSAGCSYGSDGNTKHTHRNILHNNNKKELEDTDESLEIENMVVNNLE